MSDLDPGKENPHSPEGLPSKRIIALNQEFNPFANPQEVSLSDTKVAHWGLEIDTGIIISLRFKLFKWEYERSAGGNIVANTGIQTEWPELGYRITGEDLDKTTREAKIMRTVEDTQSPYVQTEKPVGHLCIWVEEQKRDEMFHLGLLEKRTPSDYLHGTYRLTEAGQQLFQRLRCNIIYKGQRYESRFLAQYNNSDSASLFMADNFYPQDTGPLPFWPGNPLDIPLDQSDEVICSFYLARDQKPSKVGE